MDRYLGPIDVWAIAFGCIVGWGAFVMPGTTFLPIAGPAGSVIALAICTAIMLVIGHNYSFLMAHRPGTGGVYSYTKEAFGRDHAFLCTWFLSLSYLAIVFLNATAVFVLTRTLFGNMLQFGLQYQVAGYDVYLSEIALSAAILIVTGLLFILRKPLLQKIQTGLALIMIVGIVIIAGATLPNLDIPTLVADMPTSGPGPVAGALTIILLAPWAFVGFDIASLETAHFKRSPARPWGGAAIAIAILLGGFSYITLLLVSVSFIPDGFSTWRDYFGSLDNLAGIMSVPTFFATVSSLGAAGKAVVGITALAAILTGIIGASRGTVRMLSTMAEDRILSKEFLGTTFCILFIMIISIIISFLGRNALEWFVELTSFGATVGFTYASAAAWKIANLEGDTRVRITGMLGTAISGIFAVVQLLSQIGSVETMGAPSFLLLAIWCLLGFLFYWRTMRQSNLSDFDGVSTSSTVLFCLLFYAVLMWFVKSLFAVTAGIPLQSTVLRNGIILVVFVLGGLGVMLYVQAMLRRRHEELRRDMIRAEESSKAKSQFLFNMSHDIRTPLNAIIGYTHLAQQETDTPERTRTYIAKIEVAGNSLLSLINDVLEMSRIESGKMELEPAPCDLNKVLDAIHDLFDMQMSQKGIAFSVDAQMEDTVVLCDEGRLDRVIHNLLSNAYKFTPAGGTVTLTFNQVESPAAGRAAYELRVKDTGIGMSPEFAERVFDAFERERTSTMSGIQGTGLGMAITKKIVDVMGGTIGVETAPGQGTEFTVRLPFDLPEDAEKPVFADTAATTDESAELDLASLRLLVAEDNVINREIVLMLLGQHGIAADVAENGRQAVDMITKAAPGRYDAVLMDIQMPMMNGYEATRAIRGDADALIAAIPIIAVTANAFGEDVSRAREAGMDAHIAKPIDPDKLVATLRQVLQAR